MGTLARRPVWLLAFAAALAGCLETQNRLTSRKGDETILAEQRKLQDVEFTTPWRRIYIGDHLDPQFRGYVESRTERREGLRYETHWVYDENFTVIGYFTESGATYRVPERLPKFTEELEGDRGTFRQAEVVDTLIGDMAPGDSLQEIFRVRGHVLLKRMPRLDTPVKPKPAPEEG